MTALHHLQAIYSEEDLRKMHQICIHRPGTILMLSSNTGLAPLQATSDDGSSVCLAN